MAAPTVLGPSSVLPTYALAQAGQYRAEPDGILDGQWTGAPVTDVWTLTQSGANDSTAYPIVFILPDGSSHTLTYTSGSSATTATIAAGILAAALADPVITSWIVPSSPTSTTVRFTAIAPGTLGAFTPSESSGDQSLAHTATGADASTLAFGRGVSVSDVSGATPVLAALSSVATTESIEVTVVADTGSTVHWTLTDPLTGSVYTGESAYSSSSAVTVDAVVAAFNKAVPAAVAVATDGTGGVFTIAAGTAGRPIVFTGGTSGGTTNSVTTVPGGAIGADIRNILVGITGLDATARTDGTVGADAAYQGNDTVSVVQKGEVWVAIDASVGLTSTIYVGTGASNSGQFFASSDTDRCPLPRDLVKATRYDSTLGLAKLIVSFPAL